MRKVGLSLHLQDEQKLAEGNGISKNKGLWVEERKEGSLANLEKGNWKANESEAQGREVRNEFVEVGKGLFRLGFSGCVKI